MMSFKTYYPVYLDIAGQKCLVVGGGKVAERKVLGLLEAEAAVAVVSPTLTERLEELCRAGRITHHPDRFHPRYLEGAVLVIAATDDPQVNREVAGEARARGLLISVVDAPEQGNFLVPAVLRRGPLVISVSTSGLSPLVARMIRQDLERRYGPEYAEVLAAVGRLRSRLKIEVRDPEARILRLRKAAQKELARRLGKKGERRQEWK
jgi:precorrin-2 dehydrogenase/sirohydrochlorin ferrochelatase